MKRSLDLLVALTLGAGMVGCSNTESEPQPPVTVSSTTTVTPSPSKPNQNEPSKQPDVPASQTETQAPAPMQEEPVIGFTEAPGHVAPHQLDKQIASCGDVRVHETGTTFFTDGTSGWTEYCANQMM